MARVFIVVFNLVRKTGWRVKTTAKSNVTLLKYALVVLCCAGCTSEKWLDDQAVDLGDRLISSEEKQPVVHTFQIRNPRGRVLQIEKDSVSCGCTEADLDRDSIGAGEVANLKFSVAPSNNSRNHMVYATIKTDDAKRPLIKFTLTWNALSHLSAASPDLVNIDIPKSGSVQQTVEFRGYHEPNSPDRALTVACADELVRVLSVTAEPGATRQSGMNEVRYQALIEATSAGTLSTTPRLQWLTASFEGRHECRVPLRIKQELFVKVSPTQVFLRSQDDGLEGKIALQSSTRFRVLEASITPQKWRCDIALPEVASDLQELGIRVHANSVDSGAIKGQLLLKLDHPEQSEITIPLSGYLRPSAS